MSHDDTAALISQLSLSEATRVLKEISTLSNSLDRLVQESVNAVLAER